MEPIRVGLVGYGMAGQVFHAPLITSIPGLRLQTVVERSSERSAERYPWVQIARSLDALLADTEIELVVIATPNSTHFDFARQALQAGKHVVVDKPFTNTSKQAATLIRLAADAGRILSIFQNRRWDGDFLTVRRLLDAGMLGDPVEYEACFDRFRPERRPGAWREQDLPGSGLLYDLGSHLIDQALVLFGLPQRLSAAVQIQREWARVDDAFDVHLDYGGLQVWLRAGMLMRSPRPRFRVQGSTGSYVKSGTDPQEESLKAGLVPDGPHWGQDEAANWGHLQAEIHGLRLDGRIETLPGNYPAFYENLVQAIRHGADLAVRPEQALRTIRIIELARESGEEGSRRPQGFLKPLGS